MNSIDPKNTPILYNFINNDQPQLNDHTPIEDIGKNPSHFTLFQRIVRLTLKSIGAPLPKQLQYNDQESKLRQEVVLLNGDLQTLKTELENSNSGLRKAIQANEQALAHLKQDLKSSKRDKSEKRKDLAEEKEKLTKLQAKPHLHPETIRIR